MNTNFSQSARAGEHVFITDVRNTFNTLDLKETIRCILTLPDGATQRFFEIHFPPLTDDQSEAEKLFIYSYVQAEVYNFLTCLGGHHLDLYADVRKPKILSLIEALKVVFCLDKPRSKRTGYGRVVNVLDRMLNALHGEGVFEINIFDREQFPLVPKTERSQTGGGDIFSRVPEGLDKKIICGLDIGGTDIKAAVAVYGKLVCMKEFDWFPESYAKVDLIINPICLLVRLMKVQATLSIAGTGGVPISVLEELEHAMDKDCEYSDIESAVLSAERAFSDHMFELDAIGMCFPDVVVKNKIVGGEVPKTRGMRNNPGIDYEQEFARLTALDEQLRKLVRKDGVVMNTNDGPMAAFTAAVELAASPASSKAAAGVFAHSLGTDLGTGWVTGDGKIPEIPLEMYNLVIDLGKADSMLFPADDVRSINNTNTNLPGTLQKYTSQTGAFRIAAESFPAARPDIYQEILDNGFIESATRNEKQLIVPTSPDDMRKAFLAFLMQLPEREQDEWTEGIFRQIGTYLAITWIESEHILQSNLSARFLFGRLVKIQRCFELMQEGAAERAPELELIPADSELACTSLMKQLDRHADFTVAQFGQSVGAIYFANSGLIAAPR